MIAGSAYTLMALGFGLIFRVCHFFHFTHGAVFTVAAYLTYTFKELYLWSTWIAVPAAIIASASLGSMIEKLIYEPMRRRGASPVNLLIASLGTFIMLQNTISLIFGDSTRKLSSWDVVEELAFLAPTLPLFR